MKELIEYPTKEMLIQDIIEAWKQAESNNLQVENERNKEYERVCLEKEKEKAMKEFKKRIELYNKISI